MNAAQFVEELAEVQSTLQNVQQNLSHNHSETTAALLTKSAVTTIQEEAEKLKRLWEWHDQNSHAKTGDQPTKPTPPPFPPKSSSNVIRAPNLSVKEYKSTYFPTGERKEKEKQEIQSKIMIPKQMKKATSPRFTLELQKLSHKLQTIKQTMKEAICQRHEYEMQALETIMNDIRCSKKEEMKMKLEEKANNTRSETTIAVEDIKTAEQVSQYDPYEALRLKFKKPAEVDKVAVSHGSNFAFYRHLHRLRYPYLSCDSSRGMEFEGVPPQSTMRFPSKNEAWNLEAIPLRERGVEFGSDPPQSTRRDVWGRFPSENEAWNVEAIPLKERGVECGGDSPQSTRRDVWGRFPKLQTSYGKMHTLTSLEAKDVSSA